MTYTSQNALRTRLENLEGQVNKLKNKEGEIILFYEQYEKMKENNYPQYKAIVKQWNEYYQLASETPEAKAFKMSMDAWRRGDMTLVKEIAKRSKARKENGEITQIAKPGKYDPDEIGKSWTVTRYLKLKQAIAGIKSQLNIDEDKEDLAETAKLIFI